jgi:anaerobic dimethyl sulfoxide reductase subunit C (anchor subunit)
MNNELPLVLFTLFGQASVGLMMADQVTNRRSRSAGPNVLPWVLGCMAVALAIALFHLGSPLAAFRAVVNLSTSWLSREIFFAGLFLGVVWICYQLQKREAKPRLIQRIRWAAVFTGVLCVVSMASVYTNSAVAAWETYYTHISFYSTAVTLGCVFQIAISWRERRDRKALMVALVFGACAAVLQLAGIAPYLMMLASGPPAAQQSLRLLADLWPVLVCSQLLALAGLGAMVGFWQTYRKEQMHGASRWLYGSLLAFVLAAGMGRFLFYACGVLPMGQ